MFAARGGWGRRPQDLRQEGHPCWGQHWVNHRWERSVLSGVRFNSRSRLPLGAPGSRPNVRRENDEVESALFCAKYRPPPQGATQEYSLGRPDSPQAAVFFVVCGARWAGEEGAGSPPRGRSLLGPAWGQPQEGAVGFVRREVHPQAPPPLTRIRETEDQIRDRRILRRFMRGSIGDKMGNCENQIPWERRIG